MTVQKTQRSCQALHVKILTLHLSFLGILQTRRFFLYRFSVNKVYQYDGGHYFDFIVYPVAYEGSFLLGHGGSNLGRIVTIAKP